MIQGARTDWGTRLTTIIKALGWTGKEAGRQFGRSRDGVLRSRRTGRARADLVRRILDFEEVYARQIEEYLRTGKPQPTLPSARPPDLQEMG